MPNLDPDLVATIVDRALAEDIGSGDATTLAVVAADQQAQGVLRLREEAVIAGLPVAEAVFRQLDDALRVTAVVRDGERAGPGTVIATIDGPARPLLTGERTALNFLQRLSGIATMTRRYVDALGDSRTRLLDTRKTTPGLRILEKYAVACGGAVNHRVGLYDRVMIKDNHRFLAALAGPGGIARAVAACREAYPDLDIEVEVDSLEELAEALRTDADCILLDNMDEQLLAAAVAARDQAGSGARLEASGNVTIERLPAIGMTGVDFVSVGALTHSVRAIDIGLDLEPA